MKWEIYVLIYINNYGSKSIRVLKVMLQNVTKLKINWLVWGNPNEPNYYFETQVINGKE